MDGVTGHACRQAQPRLIVDMTDLKLAAREALWRPLAMLLLTSSLLACTSAIRVDLVSSFNLAAANAVSIHAIGLVGTPYRYGGNTPAGGFDCSGLIGYVFRESAGVMLPRSTSDIAKLRKLAVEADALRVGDLVLFGDRGQADHVGIYVGEHRFVHAPSSGGTVRLDSFESGYWKPRLIGGRRPFK